MKAKLKKNKVLYHYDAHCKRVEGLSPRLSGDCMGLFGNCTRLYGDCTGLYGNCTGLSGDCSGLSGDCSGLYGYCTDLQGDLDICDISEEERCLGVDIEYLIDKEAV